jgi:hypothetical protein
VPVSTAPAVVLTFLAGPACCLNRCGRFPTAIREMARDPKVGRAEAQRRSMLALIYKGLFIPPPSQ